MYPKCWQSCFDTMWLIEVVLLTQLLPPGGSAARGRPKPAFFFKFPGKRAARALVLWPTHHPTVIPNSYNPPTISLLEVISRVFPSNKIQHVHIPSVSGHSFTSFKIGQIVAGTSVISQFHDFFKSNFWRVFCYVAQLWTARKIVCSFLARTDRKRSKATWITLCQSSAHR